ncbi:MAG: hypothetical protein E7425_07955 [Ruminococcaceae bacterium]|nr:hypothetical protein [Oscillospiraceae bacterium]
MDIEIWEEVTTSDAFRDLFKHQHYEEYVFQIISKSKKFFGNCHFDKVTTQSDNEPDFIDIKTKDKYEVKLLFDEKMGVLIGDRKNKSDEWIKRFLQLRDECGKQIIKRDFDVSSLKMYQITKERLNSIEKDETAIFFIPFPLVENGVYDGAVSRFATDIIQIIIDQLNRDGLINGRNIYFIYPTMETNVYCIRNCNHQREYVTALELNSIVSFKCNLI